MTKEELEKEAEKWLCNNLHSANEEDFIKAMVDIAEPREKRIAELEATCNKWFEHFKNREEELLNELNNQNAKYNKQIEELEDKLANADYQLEGRDIKIKELEEQIEKLIDFVLSKTECCDVCPITDTCINDEGTCPYAGIFSKGEEAVTREWLMKKIAKEIKEE